LTSLQLVDQAAEMLEKTDPGAYVCRLTEGTLRSITIDGTFYFGPAGNLISPEDARALRDTGRVER
jgi:hypothetical protein